MQLEIRRIERLWRELWTGCAAQYYWLFCQMEEENVLDPTDERHLSALHYVYIPRIQRHVDQFVDAFNNRPMRTEHGRSPKQLWIGGSIADYQSGNSSILVNFFSVIFNIIPVAKQTISRPIIGICNYWYLPQMMAHNTIMMAHKTIWFQFLLLVTNIYAYNDINALVYPF